MKSLLLLSLAASAAWANTITASAGNMAKAKDVVSNGQLPKIWNYDPPKDGSGVTWHAGVDVEDGVEKPNLPESAFDEYFDKGKGRKKFDGFVDNPDVFTGPLGSEAINEAAGHSDVTPSQGSDNHTNYSATWTITATGSLGKAKTVNGVVQNPNWHSVTQANDPWNIDPADFLPLDGISYDLFFMSGVDSIDLDPVGDFDYDVYYATADGVIDLLDVSGGVGGVTVKENSSAGISIYQLTSQNEGAADITSSALTVGQIQDLFQSVVADGKLDSPITFGFVLQGLPIPTVDMGDGAVASMHVDATVVDSANGAGNTSAPEPSAWFLIATGLFAIARVRRPRRSRLD